MFGATTDVTQSLLDAVDLEGIDPYADWERATRPPGAATAPLWQPVYVEILPNGGGSYARSARTLLTQIATSREIAVESPTREALQRLAGGGVMREADRRFFVFRPEQVAARASLVGGESIPVRLLHLGPALPTAFENGMPSLPPLPAEIGTGLSRTVLTGVIDDVMGFANERFRAGPVSSRVERFWMQAMPSITAGRAVIGGEIDRAGIDALLRAVPAEADVYDRLFPGGVYVMRAAPRGEIGLVPYAGLNARPFGHARTHGTQVLDLAAGWPMGSAPADRPILAVQLPQLATLETWGARLDLFVLLALQRLFHWADRWPEGGATRRAPLVVNLSYGVLAGPKDGTGLIEAEIARLVAARNAEGVPTAVVLPAGNGYRDRCRAEMALAPGETGEVTLRLLPDDQSVTFVEIFLDGLDRLRLGISPPQGVPFDRLILPADAVYDWQGNLGGGLSLTMARIYVRPAGSTEGGTAGRTRVTIAFLPSQNHEVPHQTVPAGAYQITLANLGTAPLGAVIEPQRDETPPNFPSWGRQAYLDDAQSHGWDPEVAAHVRPQPGSVLRRTGTLSAYATARTPGVVVVGGAFDRDALSGPALYSAAGPTPGRARPDLAAVSEESRAHPGVLAATTLSGGAAEFSGTSGAAPQVTRALVQALAADPGASLADVAALVGLAPAGGAGDARLGAGVLPFAPQPGRPARRLRG
ncbi:MAG: S8 family serine peptidase [Paracoccaceae bacterium]